MTIQALFGLSIIMSFVASGIVAWLFLWPWLRSMPRDDALLRLLVPHTFRFIGLSFLVPGVVSPMLFAGFCGAGRLRRSHRGSPRGRRDLQPALPGDLGDPAHLGIQSVGHGRSDQRVLSGRAWRGHRSRLARRGVLHPDRTRAAAVHYPRADFSATVATSGTLKSQPPRLEGVDQVAR
jgi:hypothetical protein